MDLGSYKKKIDFDAFRVHRFVAYLFATPMRSCGDNTIALLTGELPHVRKNDWTERCMVAFLRNKQFNVTRLTMRNVTNSLFLQQSISRDHVVLLRMKFIKGEASWAVIYNDIIYHNFEVTSLDSYHFLNCPIMSAFLLMHKSWKYQ